MRTLLYDCDLCGKRIPAETAASYEEYDEDPYEFHDVCVNCRAVIKEYYDSLVAHIKATAPNLRGVKFEVSVNIDTE